MLKIKINIYKILLKLNFINFKTFYNSFKDVSLEKIK
jgi:hypothetical protein